jgi:hypothetical protein
MGSVKPLKMEDESQYLILLALLSDDPTNNKSPETRQSQAHLYFLLFKRTKKK